MLASLFHDPKGEYSQRLKAKPEVYAAVQARTKELMKKVYGMDEYAGVQQPAQPAQKQRSAKLR